MRKYSKGKTSMFECFDIIFMREDGDCYLSSAMTIEEALWKAKHYAEGEYRDVCIDGCLEGYENAPIWHNGKWEPMEDLYEAY